MRWYRFGSTLIALGVQPGLVREGADPDVGLAGGRREVRDLGDRVGDARGFAQVTGREHLAPQLELEVRHDRDQVGVARRSP